MKFITAMITNFNNKIEVERNEFDTFQDAQHFVDTWIKDPQVIFGVVVNETAVQVVHQAEKSPAEKRFVKWMST